ncbi:hypothetical protein PR048_006075 [Dryococelus australis]|uniref:Uncharacterized protein n=1 Tax=Dryococelus australis TaxID=614101 RepID=A0ABQ9I9Y7_9NEOP|nr:hypothetical protein PR048_006075 [Dryococelus australis]
MLCTTQLFQGKRWCRLRLYFEHNWTGAMGRLNTANMRSALTIREKFAQYFSSEEESLPHRLTAVVAITRHQKWLVCKILRDSVVATGGGDPPPLATVAVCKHFRLYNARLWDTANPRPSGATESPVCKGPLMVIQYSLFVQKTRAYLVYREMDRFTWPGMADIHLSMWLLSATVELQHLCTAKGIRTYGCHIIRRSQPMIGRHHEEGAFTTNFRGSASALPASVALPGSLPDPWPDLPVRRPTSLVRDRKPLLVLRGKQFGKRLRTTVHERKLKLTNDLGTWDLGTLEQRAMMSEGHVHQSAVRSPRTSYCGLGLTVTCGRRKTRALHPRSPDLSPIDLFMECYKELGVRVSNSDPEGFVARIHTAAEIIKSIPGVIVRVRESWHRQCTICSEVCDRDPCLMTQLLPEERSATWSGSRDGRRSPAACGYEGRKLGPRSQGCGRSPR